MATIIVFDLVRVIRKVWQSRTQENCIPGDGLVLQEMKTMTNDLFLSQSLILQGNLSKMYVEEEDTQLQLQVIPPSLNEQHR